MENKNYELKAYQNKVILEPYELEPELNNSNIIMPDVGQNEAKLGKVITVGDGVWLSGKWVSTELEEGDIVYIPAMGFQRIKIGNDEYYVGPEQDILCKIKLKK